ncbi:unnamed protein product [Vitrella brassicaformis CCMP3155]|uniref:C2 domain-containing protein n=1 Tax=Vitrella brassicaformis (strain CCMP3155) TaxID=1169540 RepID=A0A0G4FH12_VITBC|nr:unnamed protein product [Vitrella brassicaformis CCMP3155]|eukprot:CEM12146.1 unnamed protein product [Vitrella brassicaformis CCMP3155]
MYDRVWCTSWSDIPLLGPYLPRLCGWCIEETHNVYPHSNLKVRVHCVKNLPSLDFLSSNKAYVSIACGNKPDQTTSVQMGCNTEWEEDIVVTVRPADRYLYLKVMNQGFARHETIAECRIPLKREVYSILQKTPVLRRRHFELNNTKGHEGHAASVELSFEDKSIDIHLLPPSQQTVSRSLDMDGGPRQSTASSGGPVLATYQPLQQHDAENPQESGWFAFS